MESKSLIFGIVGFILGGLLVSIAATTFEKPKNMAGTNMAASLEGKNGEAFDQAFVSDMVAHHQDAIDMARMAEGQANHQEVKDLSKAIIQAQQKEISQMKQWQKDWGYGDSMGR